MDLHATDAIGLLDHLGLKRVHLMGLVGIGACVCQTIAIKRPELARSMLNMGAWCEVDDFLRDQLEMFRWIHEKCGFYEFQKAVTLLSFTAEYYNANKDKLLGPKGGWKELNGGCLRQLRCERPAAQNQVPEPDHPRGPRYCYQSAHNLTHRKRHPRRDRPDVGGCGACRSRQGTEDSLCEYFV
jgi:pimeloyl-ACP methyl ester carboxylesterase